MTRVEMCVVFILERVVAGKWQGKEFGFLDAKFLEWTNMSCSFLP